MKDRQATNDLPACQRGPGRLAIALGSFLFALLAGEGWLRVQQAIEGDAPPHAEKSVHREWTWALKHLAAGQAVIPGKATYDVDLGWVTSPNLEHPRMGTNSVGMRGTREFTLERTPGVRRVLFVGDSYTLGLSADDDHAFTEVIARDLLPEWEVQNLGVSGYAPDQILLRYERDGIPYQPDVVVFGLFVRGYYRLFKSFRGYAKPSFELSGGELILRDTPVISPDELYAQYVSGERRVGGWNYSYLLGTVQAAVAKAREKATIDPDGDAWARMKAILRRFRDTAVANGSQPMLLIFPTWPTDGDSVYDQIDALAVASARELQLPYLSLATAFQAEVRRDPLPPIDRPSEEGGHLSDRGNAITAESVAAMLRQLEQGEKAPLASGAEGG